MIETTHPTFFPKGMKIYGLFKNTYDYYKWSDLVCVSTSKDSLIKHHKVTGDCKLVLSEEERKIADKNDESHYTIDIVKFIP